MKNFVYALSAILFIFWGVAFYALKVEPFIHILPVIAIISIGIALFKKTEIANRDESDVQNEITDQQILTLNPES